MLDKIFSVRLSPELHRQVDIAAKSIGLTPSEFVRVTVAERVQSFGQDAHHCGQDAQGQAQGERVGVQYG